MSRSDVVEGSTSSATASVIRDERGESVAVFGDPETAEVVAEERGLTTLSQEEAMDSMRVQGSGESVDLRLRDRKIGEVDI